MPVIKSSRDPLEKEEIDAMIYKAFELYANKERALRIASFVAALTITGIRIQEILNIKRDEIKVDWEFLYIKYTPQKRYVRTKDGTIKKIFDPVVLPFRLHEDPKKNFYNYLIMKYAQTKPMGERIWTFSRWSAWNYCKELNDQTYPHRFRHTKATLMANRGLGDSQMKKWFGWSSRSFMASYYINRSKINMVPISEKGEF